MLEELTWVLVADAIRDTVASFAVAVKHAE